MITSSITAQCCPLHIIHNVTYTTGEIHSYPRGHRRVEIPPMSNSGIYVTPRREIGGGQRSRRANYFCYMFRESSPSAKEKIIART